MSASMSLFPSQENRALKKQKLCILGPDVYPQEPRQKEVFIILITNFHNKIPAKI